MRERAALPFCCLLVAALGIGAVRADGDDDPAPIGLDAVLLVDAVAADAQDGARDDALTGFLAIQARFDTAALGWWSDGGFLVEAHAIAGRQPSSIVGDLQGTSNIEAPDEIRLHRALYRQEWPARGVALDIGLDDYNAAFDALDAAALFLHSSFGISPDIAQAEPSIFPRTGFGMRVDYAPPAGRFYLLGGIYESTSGGGFSEEVPLTSESGSFSGIEIGRRGERGKLGLGSWYSSRPFFGADGTARSGNAGVYAIAESSFGAGERTFRPFVQLGTAPDRNQVGGYLGAGVEVLAPFAARPDDRAGLAFAHARNSDRFLQAFPDRTRAETAIELTYLFELGRGFTLQPDLQVVLDPGMDPAADTAWVVTLRAGYVFEGSFGRR